MSPSPKPWKVGSAFGPCSEGKASCPAACRSSSCRNQSTFRSNYSVITGVARKMVECKVQRPLTEGGEQPTKPSKENAMAALLSGLPWSVLRARATFHNAKQWQQWYGSRGHGYVCHAGPGDGVTSQSSQWLKYEGERRGCEDSVKARYIRRYSTGP